MANDHEVFLKAYGVMPDMSLKDYVMQLPKGHKARIEYEDQRHQPLLFVRCRTLAKQMYEGNLKPGQIIPPADLEIILEGGFEWYEEAAMKTASNLTSADSETFIDAAVLGLNGEAGEIAEHIKKFRYHGHDIDYAHLAKELGDVLWYVACMCKGIGYPMHVVARMNVEKLAKRYGEKFSTEASINRDECAHNIPLDQFCNSCAEERNRQEVEG